MSAIDWIKNSIPITDVLDRYAGANFAGARTNRERFNIRCPYHNDSSPSFTVYTDTNTFRCWSGCNDGRPGDVIDIVKLSRGVDTKEAIKILIADYGLESPDSDQAKEWQKKRASREQTAALKKELRRKVMEAIDALKQVEQMAKETLSTIKTVEDLDRVGGLYHVTSQIDYWLDCLTESDPLIQVRTLQEVDRFLEKTNMKAG
ncbi:CHC2 zinc finger domain-containing protein [Domibacillus mangrovi]|uniref:Zinc finger CHC2-type domain-containing protein n=1 Tax=Domibacillus mangrovi TaxID=1714354 RepID=A0A1Q5NZM8_9BACI|nr:CHC2 zinc finger domain-containing protein [Domibacillus mangrovi]OKL35373.1 hypothetical protein BLL40_15790 [Domibacillus mangrovi]